MPTQDDRTGLDSPVGHIVVNMVADALLEHDVFVLAERCRKLSVPDDLVNATLVQDAPKEAFEALIIWGRKEWNQSEAGARAILKGDAEVAQTC